MVAYSIRRLAAFCGAILAAAVAADSLVPVAWQVRTGLHYLVEHFLAYFAVTIVFCVTLQRPFMVACIFMVLPSIMEGLQGFTPDRIPDLPTALSGAAGALAGTLLVTLLTTRQFASKYPRSQRCGRHRRGVRGYLGARRLNTNLLGRVLINPLIEPLGAIPVRGGPPQSAPHTVTVFVGGQQVARKM